MGAKLTIAEIEALNMWVTKQHGILPNQYHYSYEQGDTLIYPEHIADLLTIDKMMTNKINNDKQKQEATQKNKQKNPLGIKQGGEGFYGQTFKFNKQQNK